MDTIESIIESSPFLHPKIIDSPRTKKDFVSIPSLTYSTSSESTTSEDDPFANNFSISKKNAREAFNIRRKKKNRNARAYISENEAYALRKRAQRQQYRKRGQVALFSSGGRERMSWQAGGSVRVYVSSGVGKDVAFSVSLRDIAKREEEMREVALKQNVSKELWDGSLIYNKCEQAYLPPNGCPTITIRFNDDESVPDYTLFLQEIMCNYYAKGTIYCPDTAQGPDLLYMLENFHILYFPSTMVFQSMGIFLRVRLWGDYFLRRTKLREWLLRELLTGSKLRRGVGFVVVHDNPHFQFQYYLKGRKLAIFQGGDALLELFAPNHDHAEQEDGSELDHVFRRDFTSYVQSSLPGIAVSFKLEKVTCSSPHHKTLVEKKPVLYVDFHPKTKSNSIGRTATTPNHTTHPSAPLASSLPVSTEVLRTTHINKSASLVINHAQRSMTKSYEKKHVEHSLVHKRSGLDLKDLCLNAPSSVLSEEMPLDEEEAWKELLSSESFVSSQRHSTKREKAPGQKTLLLPGDVTADENENLGTDPAPEDKSTFHRRGMDTESDESMIPVTLEGAVTSFLGEDEIAHEKETEEKPIDTATTERSNATDQIFVDVAPVALTELPKKATATPDTSVKDEEARSEENESISNAPADEILHEDEKHLEKDTQEEKTKSSAIVALEEIDINDEYKLEKDKAAEDSATGLNATPTHEEDEVVDAEESISITEKDEREVPTEELPINEVEAEASIDNDRESLCFPETQDKIDFIGSQATEIQAETPEKEEHNHHHLTEIQAESNDICEPNREEHNHHHSKTKNFIKIKAVGKIKSFFKKKQHSSGKEEEGTHKVKAVAHHKRSTQVRKCESDRGLEVQEEFAEEYVENTTKASMTREKIEMHEENVKAVARSTQVRKSESDRGLEVQEDVAEEGAENTIPLKTQEKIEFHENNKETAVPFPQASVKKSSDEDLEDISLTSTERSTALAKNTVKPLSDDPLEAEGHPEAPQEKPKEIAIVEKKHSSSFIPVQKSNVENNDRDSETESLLRGETIDDHCDDDEILAKSVKSIEDGKETLHNVPMVEEAKEEGDVLNDDPSVQDTVSSGLFGERIRNDSLDESGLIHVEQTAKSDLRTTESDLSEGKANRAPLDFSHYTSRENQVQQDLTSKYLSENTSTAPHDKITRMMIEDLTIYDTLSDLMDAADSEGKSIEDSQSKTEEKTEPEGSASLIHWTVENVWKFEPEQIYEVLSLESHKESIQNIDVPTQVRSEEQKSSHDDNANDQNSILDGTKTTENQKPGCFYSCLGVLQTASEDKNQESCLISVKNYIHKYAVSCKKNISCNVSTNKDQQPDTLDAINAAWLWKKLEHLQVLPDVALDKEEQQQQKKNSKPQPARGKTKKKKVRNVEQEGIECRLSSKKTPKKSEELQVFLTEEQDLMQSLGMEVEAAKNNKYKMEKQTALPPRPPRPAKKQVPTSATSVISEGSI